MGNLTPWGRVSTSWLFHSRFLSTPYIRESYLLPLSLSCLCLTALPESCCCHHAFSLLHMVWACYLENPLPARESVSICKLVLYIPVVIPSPSISVHPSSLNTFSFFVNLTFLTSNFYSSPLFTSYLLLPTFSLRGRGGSRATYICPVGFLAPGKLKYLQ